MLSLHNTLTRRSEDVRPLADDLVKMYSCGPTVYRPVHIGNLRTFILADLLRRTFAYTGHGVTAVMNITDVGHMTDELTEEGRDRMELAASDEGLAPDEIAAKYTAAFLADCDAVQIRRFDVYPKATEYVPQMIEMTADLIERGHAYEHDGTVYFDVTTFPDYGKLSHQSLDAMRAGHRVEVDTVKRSHQDFTLWRAAGGSRLMKWDSPWGPGFPGWHIECSAMSIHLLGERFDIHTGGVDNVFPHHEDEVAQSEGATGHEVVSTWVHGEHLLMGRSKMAKSAGNVTTIGDVSDQGYDPLAYRYLCFTARYRRQFHFTPEALDAASTALRRLREQAALLGEGDRSAATDAELRAEMQESRAIGFHDRFMAAVEDDLDFPSALTILHEALTDEDVTPASRLRLLASWDNVLGLSLITEVELPSGLSDLIAERDKARTERRFDRADEIRERMRGEGIELLDTPAGTRWVRTRRT